MIIADQLLSEEQEYFVIEFTEDFEQDLNSLSSSEQKRVNTKIERIKEAIESNNFTYFFNHLHKVKTIILNQYTSSLYILKVGFALRIFLFYEDDPIFNRKIMILLRVCHRQDMEQVLRDLAESFYQDKLCNIEGN